MELSRRKERFKIMTILYQVFLYRKNNIEVNLDSIIKEQIEEDNDYIITTVKGVINNEKEIEILADKYLTNWKLERLGFTDQAILKVGIYELLYSDIEPKVAIDAAVELAKNYSDESIYPMINGVLDKVYKEKNEK